MIHLARLSYKKGDTTLRWSFLVYSKLIFFPQTAKATLEQYCQLRPGLQEQVYIDR